MLRQYEYSCFPRFESASFSHFVVLVLARQCAVCAGVQWRARGRTVARGLTSEQTGPAEGAVVGGSEIFQSHCLENPLYPTYCTHAAAGRSNATPRNLPRTPSTYRTHDSPHACTTPLAGHIHSLIEALSSPGEHTKERAPHLRPPPIHLPHIFIAPHYRLSSSLHTHTRKIAHRPPKRMRRQLFTNGAATCATAP